MTENNEAAAKHRGALPEYFDKIWSQALLAVSTAEEEASKVVHKVGEVAGWGQDEVKQRVREFSERLTSQRKDLERNVEDGVRKALVRLRIPRRDDLDAIGERLEKISRRIEALEKR
jgi:polyhydroxyalkanoate synthesis regulator phasin